VLPPLRIAVTSAVRHAGSADFSGYFRVVDLEAGRTLLKTSIPESAWRADDPNPRGGVRGAKGVSAHGDRLVVANSERLFVFDPAWSLVEEITHPLMGAVHDVLAVDDGFWVTCTACDLLLKVDRQGEPVESWCWRADPELVSALGFESLPPFDPDADHRDPRVAQHGVHNAVHLNGIARTDGGLLLLFGRILAPALVKQRLRKAGLARTLSRVGISRPLPTKPTPVPASTIPDSSFAIVERPDDGRPRVLLHGAGITVPNHNVAGLDGAIVYLDSNGGRLVVWDPAAKAERVSVPIPGSPSFARGLVRIGERAYLVGSQAPLALHAVDLDAGEVVATVALDGEPNESVYGLEVVPEAFASPPAAERLFASSRPVEGALR
jgi:hypothetical protein